MRIKVVPYDNNWKAAFLNLKAELSHLLLILNPVIEHIGSTSVESLAAKPIIDIQIGVKDFEEFIVVEELMSKTQTYIYYKAYI